MGFGFNPDNNPVQHPEHNGKKYRYATNTTNSRAIRTDAESERAVLRIKQILSRGADAPSFALVARRSLKAYGEMLQEMGAGEVEVERDRVRQHSHLPSHPSQ